MKCPNRDRDAHHWICLCSEKSAKHALANLFNGWLQPDEIRDARALGQLSSVTEEHAARHLAMLEREASDRMGMVEQTR